MAKAAIEMTPVYMPGIGTLTTLAAGASAAYVKLFVYWSLCLSSQYICLYIA